jgi:hypothetical protein
MGAAALMMRLVASLTAPPFRSSLVPTFEKLHRALVLFGGSARFESPQVAATSSLGILLSRIEPILSGFHFANHCLLMQGTWMISHELL